MAQKLFLAELCYPPSRSIGHLLPGPRQLGPVVLFRYGLCLDLHKYSRDHKPGPKPSKKLFFPSKRSLR